MEEQIGTLKFLIQDMLDMNSSKIETRILNNHSLKDEEGKPTSWRITIDKIPQDEQQ